MDISQAKFDECQGAMPMPRRNANAKAQIDSRDVGATRSEMSAAETALIAELRRIDAGPPARSKPLGHLRHLDDIDPGRCSAKQLQVYAKVCSPLSCQCCSLCRCCPARVACCAHFASVCIVFALSI